MKKLALFILTMCLSMGLWAQSDDFREELHLKIDSIFENIDLNSVETGIVIEHGLNIVNPQVFNGIENDSIYSNKDILKALYAGLADSKVNSNCKINDMKSDLAQIDSAKNLSILYYAYNNLSSSAFNNGKLYLENEQLKIDYSKSGEVFDYNFCFAIALGQDKFLSNTISIPVKADIFLNNTMTKIAGISIKADEGQFENTTLNTNWTHSFSDFGEHWLTFKVCFDDGFIMTCRTSVTTSELTKTQYTANLTKTIETFQTIEADNTQSGGELQTIYLNKEKTNGKFIRPLVIAGDIDLSKLLSNGGNNSNDLTTISNLSGFGSKINELSQIYDIIYLKYNNDTDDLLRNGVLFRRAIEAVNANRYTVYDKTYVVGIGIGGVIARIGINMMEKDSIDHGITKFVAVNAPFRGINIPLSLQGLMRHIPEMPPLARWVLGDNVDKAEKINSCIDNTILKYLLIQKIDGNNKECVNAQNTSWLYSNAELFVKPLNCESVAIASADYSTGAKEKIFEIKGKKNIYVAKYNIDINGYMSGGNNLIYSGNLKWGTILIPWHRKQEYEIKTNDNILPIDNSQGMKFSLSKFTFNSSLVDVSIITPNPTYIPCYSALDMTIDEFDSLSSLSNVESSKFDRCHVVSTSCTYPDYSPLLSALAYELVPHIEGETYDILGTTELTLANVPSISLIKYNWSVANGNFKVVSSSKNKAVLTPVKYSNSEKRYTDVVTVSPKTLVNIGVDLSGLSVSTTLDAASITIKGNRYISQKLEDYNLSKIPDDVDEISWSASDGIAITTYDDGTVSAKINTPSTGNWIAASFKSYGVEHEIRRSLETVTLDSVKMTLLKHWYDPNEQVDKYYIHVDAYPIEAIEEMNYCWYNTITVTDKSSVFSLAIPNKATLKTDGDIGPCQKSGSVTIKPGTSIISPTSLTDATINDLPESALEPVRMGKYEAILVMPTLKSTEVASGRITCDITDNFGNSKATYLAVESKWGSTYKVSPNPASDVLSISKISTNSDISLCDVADSDITVSLYSNQALVCQWNVDTANCQLQVGDIPNGTYFLNIQENGTVVFKQTIIVNH